MTAVGLHHPLAGAGPTPAQALSLLAAAAAPDARVLSRRLGRAAAAPVSRRRRRADRAPSAIYLNLVPLIDVVFQLLVFFIATTHFATNENVLRMDLAPRTALRTSESPAAPAAPAPAAADPFAYLEDALRIEVLPGGGIRTQSPVAAATNAEELRTLLEQARRDAANPAGSLPPSFPIVIAPHAGTTWEDAVQALNAAAAAGYRNVGFDQQPAEGAR